MFGALAYHPRNHSVGALHNELGPTGEPILLLDQDRGRWDHMLIRRGLAALERADQLGTARGPYTLQAAIAALSRAGAHPAETDWARASRHSTMRLPRLCHCRSWS